MGAGFGPGATGFVGLTVAFPALGFGGLAFAGLGFAAFAGFGFAALAFAGFGFAVAAASVSARRNEPRRSPPMRVGRVEPRLPRTLASPARLADFFAFFLADFWATRFKAEGEFPELALRRGTVIERSGRRPL